LRLYERIGLLTPVHVDGNGYRRYDVSQLSTARLISMLRRLDMPLAQVADIPFSNAIFLSRSSRRGMRGSTHQSGRSQRRPLRARFISTISWSRRRTTKSATWPSQSAEREFGLSSS
jgi:hypothetical protein